MRCGHCKQDHATLAEVRVCSMNGSPATHPQPRVQAVDSGQVPDGTYTIVTEGDRITLRLRSAEWASDLPKGSQVAEFLSGPDNETNFTGFAFVVNGRARIWKRFRGEGRPAAGLAVLLGGGLERAREAGYAYALASSRCYRCGHKLTVPASIHRGLGPVCAGIMPGEED